MRRYQKIWLINCALDKISRKKIRQAVSSVNLGLMSIASMLKMNGYDVEVIDFFVEDLSIKELKKRMDIFTPDIIGFSVYTRTETFMRHLMSVFQQLGYQGKYIAGGPHATFSSEELLIEAGVDYVLHQEGEVSFVKLMEHLNYPKSFPISNVHGISYMADGNVCTHEKQSLIDNLDALPLQPLGLINPANYSSPFTLITSRGCPGNCIYCSSRAMTGRAYRMRSAENIISEIVYMSQKLQSKKITILDDTFTADHVRLRTFMSLFTALGEGYSYRIESRADSLTETLMKELYDSGCQVIHVGIESGSQQVLNHIGKKIDLNKAAKRIVYGQTLGIHMVASFIIGHYCDTPETVEETLLLMRYLRDHGVEVSVASCTPFPGTPIYDKADKLGITIHAKQWHEYDFGNVIISTKHLSQNQLRQYLFEAIKIYS